MMQHLVLLLSLAALPATATAEVATVAPAKRPMEQRHISGWTVQIHTDLLAQQAIPTAKALELLQSMLDEIVHVVPSAQVAELQKIPLIFSPEYAGERAHAAYHPNVNWLREHGRDPSMAKCVEFTNIRIFEAEHRRMPNFALHELAHGYHDRVLGFDEPRILACYEKAKVGGKYDKVEHLDSEGRKSVRRAYAMTNHKEYFAECTEAFLARNDIYPFTREDLKQTDPEMFTLLEQIWGKLAP